MRVTTRQLERMMVYEDDEILVVHKPPFLAVETKNIRQQDLLSLLANRRAAQGGSGGIYLVHRLDQPVEGLIVLAKTREAAAALGKSMTDRGFSKEYYAVVQGITPQADTLVHMLRRDGRTNMSEVVPGGTDEGKEARLSYERLAVKNEKSLLHIILDTGRHHQIRVQLAAAENIAKHDNHEGHDHFHMTHPDTEWKSCLAHAVEIGLGSADYELITI